MWDVDERSPEGLLRLSSRWLGREWGRSRGRQLRTRWACEVDPDYPLPDHPRPGLVRPDWVNLNGPWEFAVTRAGAAWIGRPDGEILVPFALEAPLSGVGRSLGPGQCLWYRRQFSVPAEWEGKRVLLHFGAVDWEAAVFVNGRAAGHHRGGFDPFTLDITVAVERGHTNELVIAVRDSTGRGGEQRGKQSRMRALFQYSAVSGIWQTVWLEAVPQLWIAGLRITPDAAAGVVRVAAEVRRGGREEAATVEWPVGMATGVQDRIPRRTGVEMSPTPSTGVPPFDRDLAPGWLPDPVVVRAELSTGAQVMAEARGAEGETLVLDVPDAHLWSPDDPFLYDLRVRLDVTGGPDSGDGDDPTSGEVAGAGGAGDEVGGYVGIRSFGVVRDSSGHACLSLNGERFFQYGPLDQGYWPDGLYTAPTDEAARFDIETVKSLGCNTIRKHEKVEPARWYYHCDRTGMIVWQDMPHGGRYLYWRSRRREGRSFFRSELKAVVDALYNTTSIGMWTIFNEGWGQIDTRELARWLRLYDPTRPVDAASGWWDRGVGDVRSSHHYTAPKVPPRDRAGRSARALVASEFGGIGLRIGGHVEGGHLPWSYRFARSRQDLTARYAELMRTLGDLAEDGLAGAGCTQLTDVEGELNGWLTYDREVLKMDGATLLAIHKELLDRAGSGMCASGDLNPEPAD